MPPMPRPFASTVVLPAEQRGTLDALVRARSTPQALAFRCRIVLAAADRFFVRDPDGNRIELLQWERPYAPDADGRYAE